MSKWDEVHTEPMHDHPAEKTSWSQRWKQPVILTHWQHRDNLRFYGAAGNIMTMGGCYECEDG